MTTCGEGRCTQEIQVNTPLAQGLTVQDIQIAVEIDVSELGLRHSSA